MPWSSLVRAGLFLATLAGCGAAAAGGGHAGSGGGAGSSAGAAGTGGAGQGGGGGAGASLGGADGARDGAVIDASADLGAASADSAADETAGDTSVAVTADLTKVVATPGCGQLPTQALGTAVRYTIATSGQKPSSGSGCADTKCGAWSYEREYFITLPASYDGTKPLPLVFVGPGCGGVGTQLGAFAPGPPAIIRVGLTPPPNDIGHVTNPGQGCFDDKEGDDSVDFVFYESLYDVLKAQLCFDKNRVFAAGNSSGGWLAIELGCKYGGDALRPIRAVVPNNGGLPTTVAYAPTCSGKPHAGMFIFDADDSSNEPSVALGSRAAVNQAMLVDGCAQTNLALASSQDFPIGGGNPTSTCKRVVGCSPLDPIVVCQIQTTVQSSNDAVVGPGFTTFLGLFEQAPLLSP